MKKLLVFVCALMMLVGVVSAELYYPYDNDAAPLEDASGNGFDIVFNSATRVLQLGTNYEYDFDGTEYQDTGFYPTGVPITINLWVTPDTLDNTERHFVGTSDNNFDSVLNFRVTTDNKLEAYFRGEGGVGQQPLSTLSIVEGRRQMVTLVANETDIWFCVDGFCESPIARTWTGTYDLNQPLFIGARNRGLTLENFFDGRIDDVRLYTRALSHEEVQALYTPVDEVPEFGILAGAILVTILGFFIYKKRAN